MIDAYESYKEIIHRLEAIQSDGEESTIYRLNLLREIIEYAKLCAEELQERKTSE